MTATSVLPVPPKKSRGGAPHVPATRLRSPTTPPAAVERLHAIAPDLPVPRARDRRRARWLYDRTWGRTRKGAGWPLPEGTQTIQAPTPGGDVRLWHLTGAPGAGTVVLAHPDRRYGGHWFVREGWIEALQERGLGVVWFDQPGYGRGNGGSPFLYENVAAACLRAQRLDAGPVRLIGISLGAFAAAIAAAHVPLAAVVLESPYPTFGDWYRGRGWSIERAAIGAWSLAFGKSMPAVDAGHLFSTTRMPALVAWSRSDETTAAALSRALADVRPTQTYEGDSPHLGLWADPGYRAAVMDFLESASTAAPNGARAGATPASGHRVIA